MDDKRPRCIIPVYELTLPTTGTLPLHWQGDTLRTFGPILAQDKRDGRWWECYVVECNDPDLDLPRVDGWCLLPDALCILAGDELLEAG